MRTNCRDSRRRARSPSSPSLGRAMTKKKVYVQDQMREDGADLWAWLAKGAHFYVCGDATRMAPDVDATLVDICAEHGKMDAASAKAFVKDLRAQHRYQTDVY